MEKLCHFLNNPIVIGILWGALVTIIIGWFFWWLSTKKGAPISLEDKKEIIEGVMGGLKLYLNPYLDGIPQLPKTNPIRKGFDDGILAMDEEKWPDAIGIFRSLLEEAKGSQKVALFNLIGFCFYRQDNLDEALGSYKESLKLAEEIQDKEGRVANLNNIGIIYVNKGDYDTAIRDYTKAIELAPNYADAFYNRGSAYDDKKDYDTAIRDFNKAIELDPNHARAFYNRGNAYDEKGDYDIAIRDYRKTIKINPNHAKAMANMGLAYKRKGDKKSARIWWEKALAKKEYLPPDVEERVRRWLKELEE